MTTLLSIIILIIFSVSLLVFFYLHRSKKLNQKQRNYLLGSGIIHYTSKDSANKIISDRKLLASKDHKAYFFFNGLVPFNIFFYNVRKKNHRSIDCKIIITNLTENQVSCMKCRYYDSAIVHQGDFMILPENNAVIEEAEIFSHIDGFSSRKFKAYAASIFLIFICSIFPLILAFYYFII